MEKDDFLKKAGKAGCPCKSKHNTVDAGEINDFFVGDNLTPEQMDQIYSYLENRNIDVVPVLDEAMLNADPALDDIDIDLDLDDDSFMKDAEDEDIDLDAVDLFRGYRNRRSGTYVFKRDRYSTSSYSRRRTGACTAQGRWG